MKLFVCFIHIFVGALIFAIPNISRREFLFAIPVPKSFRESPAGRHAIAMFRMVVAAVVLADVLTIFLLPEGNIAVIDLVGVLAVTFAGGAAFYWQNRKLAPLAVQFSGMHEAELSREPERLPWFMWLGIVPFVVLLAAALYLQSNWSSIPARFPVHWGADGIPNRWANRTTKGVYGPLIFGAEMSAWMLMMGLACWFGSRRSRFRHVVLGVILAAEYMLGLMFAVAAVMPLLNIPVWMIAVGPILIFIPAIIVMVKKMREPDEPIEPTPNECWKGGMIYYNPNDAALFVQKRAGLGYTFNFANSWVWILMLGLGVVIASAFFVLA